jgi:hypothetical protein
MISAAGPKASKGYRRVKSSHPRDHWVWLELAWAPVASDLTKRTGSGY